MQPDLMNPDDYSYPEEVPSEIVAHWGYTYATAGCTGSSSWGSSAEQWAAGQVNNNSSVAAAFQSIVSEEAGHGGTAKGSSLPAHGPASPLQDPTCSSNNSAAVAVTAGGNPHQRLGNSEHTLLLDGLDDELERAFGLLPPSAFAGHATADAPGDPVTVPGTVTSDTAVNRASITGPSCAAPPPVLASGGAVEPCTPAAQPCASRSKLARIASAADLLGSCSPAACGASQAAPGWLPSSQPSMQDSLTATGTALKGALSLEVRPSTGTAGGTPAGATGPKGLGYEYSHPHHHSMPAFPEQPYPHAGTKRSRTLSSSGSADACFLPPPAFDSSEGVGMPRVSTVPAGLGLGAPFPGPDYTPVKTASVIRACVPGKLSAPPDSPGISTSTAQPPAKQQRRSTGPVILGPSLPPTPSAGGSGYGSGGFYPLPPSKSNGHIYGSWSSFPAEEDPLMRSRLLTL